MKITVLEQVYALLGAALIGVGTGLLYDALRAVRRSLGRPILSGILDLLFWLAVTAALFLWSVRAGRGQVHISLCLALFLGAVLYFRLLSPLFYSVFTRLMGLLRKTAGILSAPLRGFRRLVKKIQKFFRLFFKNHFSSGKK